MMKKKVYVLPLMAVIQLEAQAILAGSNGTDQSGSKVNDPFYVDPGDNTVQIGFGNGTTKNPD